jgi:hypothetical protein
MTAADSQSTPSRSRHILTALGSIVIGAMFLWFGRPGLAYYFDPDDVLNTYLAWTTPLGKMLLDCFAPARSLGLLVYKLLYALVGLHPLPFHLFCFALLAVNIYLLYCLARQLTGSWETAMFAALLGSFQSRMESLYNSVANVFDIGSHTFFLCALLFYVRLRTTGRNPGLIQNIALILMYLCALDFKEMAVMLPAVLVCYELVYHGPPRLQGSELRRWLTICILSLVTAAFMLPSFMGAASLTQVYRPQYSLHRFLDNWETYLGFLFYVLHAFSLAAMLTLLALLLAVALVLKSKPLIFCWCFILITPLPVSFIETRGLNVWYIPFVGWVIYAAALIWLLLNKLIPLSARPRARAAVALFVILAALLAAAHTRERAYTFATEGRGDQLIRRFQAQFLAVCPKLPPRSHVLFLDDPFGADQWTPVTLLRLYFHDPELQIQRLKMPVDRTIIDVLSYDFVLDYRGDRFVQLNSRPLIREEVRSLIENRR